MILIMAIIIPVAGGKGGVGKSVVSLNLAVAMANLGKKVVICDLDLGGSNLHTMLGIRNNKAGFGYLLHGLESDICNLIQKTSVPGLYFIAGDCLLTGTANIDFQMEQKLIEKLKSINCDFLFLDLGAGSSFCVVDFFLMTNNGIIVVTPEFTSVLNAYSFLKASIFRFCYRLFPKSSMERKIIQNCMISCDNEKSYTIEQIVEIVESKFPSAGGKIRQSLSFLKPRIITNMVKSNQDLAMRDKLVTLVKSKLSVNAEAFETIPFDDNVSVSIMKREPLGCIKPQSAFFSAVKNASKHLCIEKSYLTNLYNADENLNELVLLNKRVNSTVIN